MNRKWAQSVITDDRRTLTIVLGADKDKVYMYCHQTLGNNNKYAMFDFTSGFYQSEEKRCHIN